MDVELVNHIKNQVIEEIKKEYFLVRKTNDFDVTDTVKNTSFILHVTDVVCDYFKVKKEIVFLENRFKPYPEMRYIIFFLCRDISKDKISFSQIGKPFGKDHCSVLYGCKKASGLYEFDKSFNSDVSKIKLLIDKSFYSTEKN